MKRMRSSACTRAVDVLEGDDAQFLVALARAENS